MAQLQQALKALREENAALKAKSLRTPPAVSGCNASTTYWEARGKVGARRRSCVRARPARAAAAACGGAEGHGTVQAEKPSQTRAVEAERRRELQEEQLESYKFTHDTASEKIVVLDGELARQPPGAKQWRHGTNVEATRGVVGGGEEIEARNVRAGGSCDCADCESERAREEGARVEEGLFASGARTAAEQGELKEELAKPEGVRWPEAVRSAVTLRSTDGGGCAGANPKEAEEFTLGMTLGGWKKGT